MAKSCYPLRPLIASLLSLLFLLLHHRTCSCRQLCNSLGPPSADFLTAQQLENSKSDENVLEEIKKLREKCLEVLDDGESKRKKLGSRLLFKVKDGISRETVLKAGDDAREFLEQERWKDLESNLEDMGREVGKLTIVHKAKEDSRYMELWNRKNKLHHQLTELVQEADDARKTEEEPEAPMAQELKSKDLGDLQSKAQKEQLKAEKEQLKVFHEMIETWDKILALMGTSGVAATEGQMAIMEDTVTSVEAAAKDAPLKEKEQLEKIAVEVKEHLKKWKEQKRGN